jgi:hypothetical protein
VWISRGTVASEVDRSTMSAPATVARWEVGLDWRSIRCWSLPYTHAGLPVALGRRARPRGGGRSPGLGGPDATLAAHAARGRVKQLDVRVRAVPVTAWLGSAGPRTAGWGAVERAPAASRRGVLDCCQRPCVRRDYCAWLPCHASGGWALPLRGRRGRRRPGVRGPLSPWLWTFARLFGAVAASRSRAAARRDRDRGALCAGLRSACRLVAWDMPTIR